MITEAWTEAARSDKTSELVVTVIISHDNGQNCTSFSLSQVSSNHAWRSLLSCHSTQSCSSLTACVNSASVSQSATAHSLKATAHTKEFSTSINKHTWHVQLVSLSLNHCQLSLKMSCKYERNSLCKGTCELQCVLQYSLTFNICCILLSLRVMTKRCIPKESLWKLTIHSCVFGKSH